MADLAPADLSAIGSSDSKPGKPSASRWTGIAGVTRWCLQLAFFHRLFKPLMKALVSGNKANAQEEAVSLDGDVRG